MQSEHNVVKMGPKKPELESPQKPLWCRMLYSFSSVPLMSKVRAGLCLWETWIGPCPHGRGRMHSDFQNILSCLKRVGGRNGIAGAPSVMLRLGSGCSSHVEAGGHSVKAQSQGGF